MKREYGVGALALMLAAWGCNSQRITMDEPRAWTPGELAGHAMREGEDARRVAETSLTDDASEEAYLLLGARRSVRLKAAYERWRAAVARITIEGSLMDPMLSYGRFLNEFSSRQAMGQHQFELAQTFPWFGKLALREDAASHEATMAAREYEGVRLGLFRDIRLALYELSWLGQETALTRENLELTGQFEAIARTRFQVGAGMHADVIRAQVEMGKLEDRVRELERMRTPAIARLNALLAREPGEPIGDVPPIAPERLGADEASLLTMLRDHNPKLAAMQEAVERRRVMTDLARKDYWPDVTLGVMAMVDGDEPAMLRVGVNLPVWRAKLDAGVREANAMRLAAAYEQEDERLMLGSELHEALFAHDDAQRRFELYDATLLPKAEESIKASLGAYQGGTGSFLDLIDAERTLLEFRLARVRAVTDRAGALARLDAIVGERVARLGEDTTNKGTTNEATQGGGQ